MSFCQRLDHHRYYTFDSLAEEEESPCLAHALLEFEYRTIHLLHDPEAI